ncbi:MAG TPA: hypothetical protein VGJ59_22205 [Jatrophihabitantaceae bacterium]|jgi:hypothetical protein
MRPPTRAQWVADSELNGGHTTRQVLLYLSDCADYEDEQVQRRALPAGVISPDIDPRARVRGFLRRIRGRE